MTQPRTLVHRHWSELAAAMERTREYTATIERWGRMLADVFDSGGSLLACGNGGSAAEAQHLTGELVGKFRADRRPLPAFPLHADTSGTTAIVNDYGANEVFARQVAAHGRPRDVLIALSTSGTSQNVVAAAKAAREAGMTVWSLTGRAPNPLAAISDDSVAVDAEDVATVQEVHLAIVHALCVVVDDALEVA